MSLSNIMIITFTLMKFLTSCAGFYEVGVKYHPIKIYQVSYHPDVAPCIFWLFLKLKLTLKFGG